VDLLILSIRSSLNRTVSELEAGPPYDSDNQTDTFADPPLVTMYYFKRNLEIFATVSLDMQYS